MITESETLCHFKHTVDRIKKHQLSELDKLLVIY